MARRKREKKRLEFSKLIAVIAIVMWLFVNFFGMAMMLITMDLTPMMYIVGSVDAVVAVVYATYAHKAKAENLIKLKKIYGDDADQVINAEMNSMNPAYCNTVVVDDEPHYEDSSVI